MSHDKKSKLGEHQRGVARRLFLKMAVLFPVIAGGVGSSEAAKTPEVASTEARTKAAFLFTSEILTGRQGLDPKGAARTFAALTQSDPSFPRAFETLFHTLRAQNFCDMRNADAFFMQFPALKPTAVSIISAWYLGYAGKPAMHATPSPGHEVDNAHFVAYVDALMYAPTRDATVIPSYARARTNYWFYPPKSVATD